MQKTAALIFSFFIGMIIFANTAFAQVTPSIAVSLTPPNPRPNESVTINLNSYAIDMKSVNVEWAVDGKKVLSGIGKNHYSFTAKKLGEKTTVTATIYPPGQPLLIKTITVSPMSADILWQAVNITMPPLYRGRSYVPREGSVKLVVIPQIVSPSGQLHSPDDFVYTWRKNYDNVDSASGYSNNSFSSDMDYLNPTIHLGVDVSPPTGNVSASEDIDINPSEPELIFYPLDNLVGPDFSQALVSDFDVIGKKISVIAEPFFFNPVGLTYQWSLNGNDVKTGKTRKNILSLNRSASNSVGDASLDLKLTNDGSLFQEITNHLILHLK